VRADAAKDEFLSTVSHELRTPLTSITESINLVCDGTLGAVNEKQARFLEVAHRNTRRLGDIINDLLDISKIEAGRMTARPAPCDIPALLDDVAATFSPVARRKPLKLENLRPGTAVVTFADAHLVRRAVFNLVSNAVKFTDRGRITLACCAEDATAHIIVADTGTGIPTAEQPRVFERFHQAHHGANRPAGTGLGLALTREVVRLNRGRIWFESAEGKGTTFHIVLPLDRPEARLAWLLDRFPERQAGRLCVVASRSGHGISALTEDICRLAGSDGKPAPGCFLGTPPAIAFLVPGDAAAAREACRRVTEALAECSPEVEPAAHVLELAGQQTAASRRESCAGDRLRPSSSRAGCAVPGDRDADSPAAYDVATLLAAVGDALAGPGIVASCPPAASVSSGGPDA